MGSMRLQAQIASKLTGPPTGTVSKLHRRADDWLAKDILLPTKHHASFRPSNDKQGDAFSSIKE